MDEAIQTAINEYTDWYRQARPSAVKVPQLVLVRDGNSTVLRRPFKRRGSWCVRWQGTARLTEPHQYDGMTAFHASWA